MKDLVKHTRFQSCHDIVTATGGCAAAAWREKKTKGTKLAEFVNFHFSRTRVRRILKAANPI